MSVQSVEAGSDMQDCTGARSEVRLLQVEAEHLAGTLDQRLIQESRYLPVRTAGRLVAAPKLSLN